MQNICTDYVRNNHFLKCFINYLQARYEAIENKSKFKKIRLGEKEPWRFFKFVSFAINIAVIHKQLNKDLS